MSRIGKQPVNIPDKVDVKIANGVVTVKGPNGQLEYKLTNKVKVELKDKKVLVNPADTSNLAKAAWGLTRTLIGNMVTGVTKGFTTTLEFNGVGYRAAVQGSTLNLNLGYSHPIEYKLPKGITAKVVKNTIEINGSDKELVGLVSAKVRSFRPPEPYKGKGLKYIEEVIIRKAGKTGAKK